ncbi:MAG: 2-dehydropantoate 2-reductase N-terminal domain-containing protein, partial [Acetobacteraceae bacterium]|nr:2-dehydropantoate 2-reductase N-terminal domain-containing protein [Acetobacteraceae bacterium]
MFGAGSVGGYLAGFQADAAAAVSVIARGPHLAAIQAHGLTVETPDHTIVARVTATDDPATLPPQDAVL